MQKSLIKTAIASVVITLTLTAILSKCNKNVDDVSVVSDTVITFDTVYLSQKTKPKIIYSQVIDTFKVVDTIEVVRDYQTMKIYADSLKNDTISILVQDTIFKNSILGRNIAYTLRLPTKTITNTITIKKANKGLYLSGIAGNQLFGGATYVNGKYFGSVYYGNGGLLVGGGIKIF